MGGIRFSEEQIAFLRQPDFTLHGYYLKWPDDPRSPDAILRGHRRHREGREKPRPSVIQQDMKWDKRMSEFHWEDVLDPLTELQTIQSEATGYQDHAQIIIETDQPVPIIFISDWHIGSWGTDYHRLARITKSIKDHNIRIAVLGDMLQMSTRLRSVLEMSDNALPPHLQQKFLESWLWDIFPLLIWSTSDNHSVERQEDAIGFSPYADQFARICVYHNGIGHIDLTVGEQTYKIASSHRFRGNTPTSPVAGQKRYMRQDGIDREIAVAGDSHRPAYEMYPEGPLTRLALNCGSLQLSATYAKRFVYHTHDWQPVVVFYPDEHLFVPYPTLDHYIKSHGSQESP